MRIIVETIVATVLVPGVAVTFFPYLILTASNTGWPERISLPQLISIPGMIIGLGMVCWVSSVFVAKGKGTPIPVDPPLHFVSSGLFQYVRNPMYFGALLVLVSEALFFSSTWLLVYAFLLWFALHIFLVVFEEPQLTRRFGESFQTYLGSTPRWIPRVPRRDDRTS